jgi:hypothetical protein
MKINISILSAILGVSMFFASACQKADNPTTLPQSPAPTGCTVSPIPVAVNAAGVTFNRDTSSSSDRFGGASCQSGSGAPDDLFAFTLDSATRVRVTKTSTWASRVYLRGNSCEGTEAACYSTGGDHDIDLPAGTYYLIVDGNSSGDEGAYQLILKDVTP